LLISALCILLLAPIACRRGEAPTDPAASPVTPTRPAAAVQGLAERERAVAEREASVAQREAALAPPTAAPAHSSPAPRRPRVEPIAAPQATAPPPAPVPTESPTPRPPVELVVPAGTALALEFAAPIASNTVAAGSVFAATVTNDVYVGRALAIPAGTEVLGTVTEAVPAKKIGGQARLALSFTHLRLATGETIPIAATFAEAAKNQTGKDAATIGGSAAGGAVLGRVIDHGDRTRGTVLGAVVGGAIGTAIAAQTPGEEVRIAAGTVIEVRLTAPVTVPE
jgi:type IV secretory pathway VirB10-like protein